jgi:hypothetical protein
MSVLKQSLNALAVEHVKMKMLLAGIQQLAVGEA